MANRLFELTASQDIDALAIVGMTKNVGKTVTLNYLVSRYAGAGRTVGLVSAGYDGERFDRLTLREKPRINAPAGSLVATAAGCFEAAGAKLELLYHSPLATPLGEVLVARITEAGLVELAGPGSVKGLRLLTAMMKIYGAEPVLVDGAINRIASASPDITGGTVLASGAAVAPVLGDIIRKTLFRCQVLETPGLAEGPLRLAALEALVLGEAALIHQEGAELTIELVRAPTPLLAAARICERCREATTAVFFKGAVVDSLLGGLMELPSPVLLIAQDPTRLFVSPEFYRRFIRQGGEIRVLHSINLIAVTLNPTDPLGRGYPPRDFLEQLAEALAPRPVFDLVLQEGAGN